MEKDYIYNVLLERGYNTYTARLVAEELLKLHKPLSDYLAYWLGNEPEIALKSLKRKIR